MRSPLDSDGTIECLDDTIQSYHIFIQKGKGFSFELCTIPFGTLSPFPVPFRLGIASPSLGIVLKRLDNGRRVLGHLHLPLFFGSLTGIEKGIRRHGISSGDE